MKKKLWIAAGLSLLAAGLMVAGLAGCGSSYKFETYSYNNGGTSEKDWRALEYPDEEIAMDGVVTAAEYGEGYLSFSDVNDVNMKVYAHMGKEGVFFGFVSNDQDVNYNPRNDVFNNTSVEIQVAPFGTSSLNVNVVQLRLSASGVPDQWVGLPADDGYPYTKKYVPSMGTVHINGELNGEADGYSIELYLPYTSIGLAEKPESVICAPSFNTLPTRSDDNRATWTMMLGCNLSEPATWYVVNDTGMTTYTAGFSKTGSTIKQEKGYNEFYYFDSVPQKAYYLKSTLQLLPNGNAFLNGDKYPKFGLINRSETEVQTFHIDAAQQTGTNFGTCHAAMTTNEGTYWGWDDNASTSFPDHWGNGVVGDYGNIPMETIYYGGNLYFVLDGVLVKSVHDFAADEDGAIPGFICFNTMVTFKNNEYVKDEAAVKTELDKYIGKSKPVTIDGDFTDWTDADVNRHCKEVEDSGNGNSLKVRAFRGEDGLYLAYEVHHKVNAPITKWDTAWWENTNIEFYVNGTGEGHHYAVTAFGSSGYMDAVMLTSQREDKTYDTVGEIFVPFASLEKDGFDTDGALKVGFAFKAMNNDNADAKLNGGNWWYFGGDPSNIDNQHQVLEKGIGTEYTLTYKAGEGEGEDIEAKVFEGDTIELPDCTFTKDGYRFLNWSDGETRYAAGTEYTMPGEEVELTAMWISNEAQGTYHVTYEKGTADDGNITGEVPTDTNEYAPGEGVTVKDRGNLACEGYRFMGWSDGNGTTYKEGATAQVETSDLTLTAVWSKEYTLTYELDEGTSGPAAEKRIAEEKFNLSDVIPTKDDYEFSGWLYEGTVYDVSGAFTMPAEDVTLTAQWSKKITVDGSLTDWTELASRSLESHSFKDKDHRGGTWYGVLRGNGLYLAAELWYNEEARSGLGGWFNNLNFEIRIKDKSGANHYYVYLASGKGASAVAKFGRDEGATDGVEYKYTYEAGTEKGTAHHSIFEVFMPAEYFAALKEADGSLRVGLAVKTGDYNGGAEKITGGSVNYEGGDTWYAPYGVWPDDPALYAYVDRNGLLLKDEHDHPDWTFGADSATVEGNGGITLDGDLTDWSETHTIGITGTDQFEGKSVKFYGKLTKTGLYLAVDAYHATLT